MVNMALENFKNKKKLITDKHNDSLSMLEKNHMHNKANNKMLSASLGKGGTQDDLAFLNKVKLDTQLTQLNMESQEELQKNNEKYLKDTMNANNKNKQLNIKNNNKKNTQSSVLLAQLSMSTPGSMLKKIFMPVFK